MKILPIVWFLLLFNSGGVRIFPNFLVTTLVLIVLLGLMISGKKFNLKLLVFPLIVFIVIMLFNLVSTGISQNQKFYIIQFSFFVIAAIFYAIYGKNNHVLNDGLFSALKFYMYYALVAFVIGIVLKGFAKVVVLSGSIEKSIFYLFYYPEADTLPFIMRNQGLFWEPGVLQYYMNVLLLMALHRKDRKISLLAVITVLTTFSTTGYLALSIIFLVLYLKNTTVNAKNRMLYFVGGLIIALPLAFLVYGNLEHKFSRGIEGGGHSAAVRFHDFEFGMAIIEKNALIGLGLDAEKLNDAYNTQYTSSSLKFLSEEQVEQKGFTNSMISTAIMWGIPVSIIFLVLLYRQRVLQHNRFLFFVVTILFLIGEPLFMSPFIALLQVSAFQTSRVNRMSQYR